MLHLTEQRTGNTSVCLLYRLFAFMTLFPFATLGNNRWEKLGERVNFFHQYCRSLFFCSGVNSPRSMLFEMITGFVLSGGEGFEVSEVLVSGNSVLTMDSTGSWVF